MTEVCVHPNLDIFANGKSFCENIRMLMSLSEDPPMITFLKSEIERLTQAIAREREGEQKRKIVLKLLDQYQPAQLTKDWYDLRNNMLTASSDIGVITKLSYDHKTAKSQREHEHLLDILVLKKCGIDIKKFTGNALTLYGQKFEQIVSNIYCHKTKSMQIEFGLLKHNKYPFIGASPDGISPNGLMIEIKCPQRRQITGNVPSNYWCQMQVQLEVCDLDVCDFVECQFNTMDMCDAGVDNYHGVIGVIKKCRHMDVCECREEFIYPDLFDRNFELLTEHAQTAQVNSIFSLQYADKYRLVEMSKWSLTKYSCVQVSRDKNWFQDSLAEIERVWKLILHVRKDAKLRNEIHQRVLSFIRTKTKGPSGYLDALFADDE